MQSNQYMIEKLTRSSCFFLCFIVVVPKVGKSSVLVIAGNGIGVNVVSVVFEITELAFNRFKIMYIKKSSKGSKIFSLDKEMTYLRCYIPPQ